MSFSGAMTTLATHLASAGTAMTRPVTLVRRGLPASAPTDQIAYWYEGDGEPANFEGDTLTDHIIGERVTVAVYYRIADLGADVADDIDTALQDAVYQIKRLLIADSTLGDNCADLEVGSAETDFVTVASGQVLAMVQFPLTLDLAETYTIGT